MFMLIDINLTLVLALAASFLMACAVGANDVANAMGTSVGCKVINLKQAVLIAAIFEAMGALLASSEVTTTIRQGVVDLSFYANDLDALILGMVACLLASASWLILATYFAWPVSTTHSIIGSLVGFSFLVGGAESIHWWGLLKIFSSWVTGPVISGAVAYFLFKSLQRFIFSSVDPIKKAILLLPIYGSIVGVFIGISFLSHQLNDLFWTALASLFLGFLTFCILSCFYKWTYVEEPSISLRRQFEKIEKMFGFLVVMTASFMAFAHGSNDVANAIGPLSVIIGLQDMGYAAMEHTGIPLELLLFGAVGVVIGLAIYGYRIIETVGNDITLLTPTRSFSAQLATSIVVVVASLIGLPVSTTQILVGSILGVGFARGIEALNLKVVKNIFMSWIITLPSGAVLSMGYYLFLNTIM